ncbi:MAG: threonine--tRNA ligase [Pseudomonadota bacterium]
MISITLPDGSSKQIAETSSVLDLAKSIGEGLARVALAAEVNDKLVDLDYHLTQDANVKIITAKDKLGLEIIRHSCAHLLAHAVKQLFPEAQVTIGPVIDDGFYYDFAYKRPFTPEDLVAIEKRMQQLAKQAIPVHRREMQRDEAIAHFKKQGELYKVQIIEAIPANEVLSFYQQEDFTDLCRGPHVPNTKLLKHFKLMKLAGAYWRGDSNNEMLQRIYGTAWASKDDLKAYLHRLEEAEKRDHRKLGKLMDLFHFQDIAPGMAFWHDKGWRIYQIMENYIRAKLKKYDYEEIKTPQVVSRKLWEKSGHWDKFAKEMFITETEDHVFAVKPMSCPGHVQIFNHNLRSYKELPLRFAEFGNCHRNEPSGALHGLMRVRNMVQDDGHVFCTEEQIQSVVTELIRSTYEVYADFGFKNIIVKLSTRPDERVGSDAIWDKAENGLQQALEKNQVEFEIAPKEGAFYGPKIEFSLQDCIGRIWQCGTIQLDFAMPERLGAEYVAEDGSRKMPVMVHRAILGSIERFMGIIIEHYAGWLPLWLAPVQATVLNITDHQADYARALRANLQTQGFRIELDLRNEKVGYKIREHTIKKVPYLIIVGDKELENNTLTLRKHDGTDLGAMTTQQFIDFMHKSMAKLS